MSKGREPPVNRSWHAPECLACETDLFVTRDPGAMDYRCQYCGGRWSE